MRRATVPLACRPAEPADAAVLPWHRISRGDCRTRPASASPSRARPLGRIVWDRTAHWAVRRVPRYASPPPSRTTSGTTEALADSTAPTCGGGSACGGGATCGTGRRGRPCLRSGISSFRLPAKWPARCMWATRARSRGRCSRCATLGTSACSKNCTDGGACRTALPGRPSSMPGPRRRRQDGRSGRWGPPRPRAWISRRPNCTVRASWPRWARDVGPRPVRQACIDTESVYFAAVGGAAAFLAKCVESSHTISYDDLGTEALRRIDVVQFPVFVGIDVQGPRRVRRMTSATASRAGETRFPDGSSIHAIEKDSVIVRGTATETIS